MLLHENIESIKGIGEKTASLFNKLGVFTIEQLLHNYPRNHIKYDNPVPLSSDYVNTRAAFRLFIPEDFKNRKVKNLSIMTGYATDGNNRASITYFNAQYYQKALTAGKTYIFYGKLLFENNRYKLEQPLFFKEEDYAILQKTLQPVYHLTFGLNNKAVSKSVKYCVEDGAYQFLYEEYLPENVLKEFDLVSRKDAIVSMHFPKDFDELMKARKRLVFDELFIFLAMLKKLKTESNDIPTSYPMINTAGPYRLIEALPFKLTNAQKRVFDELAEDLCSNFVANRLIQGDVGSGKTIVSFLGLLLCVENGYQGALMAPTELLASQHFENLSELVKKYNLPIKPVLLTGSIKAAQKREIYEKIASGEYNVVIGTHAIIQDKVEFKKLALVITDEQHRFGVKQRQTLGGKGDNPHVLVMSATPIPRTLAIILFGDMHLSVIDEKPSNRLPIKNCVVGPSYRPKAYEFIKKEIDNHHQVYVVCPMVEKSEGLEDVENVIDYASKLRNVLGESYRVEYLHGKMKAADKKRIMDMFAAGNIDILVSTTVIEVGIDVPNATVMMVENAERFGLSTLHQLRGRIGRGKDQSYTIFMNCKKDEKESKRLNVMNSTNDGFEIASQDLKIRGSGDLFGIRQSGDMEFELANIYEDADLIVKINKLLDEIDLDEDRIKSYLEENKHKFIDFGSI